MGDEAGSCRSLCNESMCEYGVELGAVCVCICAQAHLRVCAYVSVLGCVETEATGLICSSKGGGWQCLLR